MKVNELLVSIRRTNFDFEKELQIKKYLPIEVKKTIAQGIIYDSSEEEDGITKFDSVKQYLSYVKYMITMHTNLDYNEDEDYDKLCSTMYEDDSLLNAIFSHFSDDAKECSKILGFMVGDIEKSNSINFVVARFLNNIGDKIGNVSNIIEQKIKDLDTSSIIPSDMDLNKLNEFLGDYMK